ncbi:MAG TPA: translation initiation factor IF-2 [Phycisphaerae bacterium]|nr:translation initiation factor IF-2 [Phycisphaerae bacterium]
MAEKKVRVHNLAKELDVSSQDIIEKCRAEGIEIKNHMHVVSAGLEATIREWFSEGTHATTLEESKRVDLTTVRKPARRKKKAESAPTDEGGIAVMEPPPEEAKPAEPTVKKPSVRKAAEEESPTVPAEPMVQVPSVVGEPPAAPSPEEAPAQPQEPLAAPAPEVLKPAAKVQPPAPPAKPATAGPQNIPRPAKLSGPKVVRMDKPETIEPRRSFRPPPRPPVGPPPRAETEEERRVRARGPLPAKGRTGDKDEGPADTRVHPRRGIRDQREEVNEKLKEWRDRDLVERKDRLAHASGRGIGGLRAIEGKQSSRRPGQRAAAPVTVKKDKVELTEPILIKDFSRETGIAAAQVIKKLMEEHAQLAGINSVVPTEVAQAMALENGIELTVAKAKTALDLLQDEFAALERKHVRTRPPVVTVLGHVDHGKTSLLDRIRNAKVAAGEAGGITQHIGAYQAHVGDKAVTFLDTPGHTAFTAMRARGTHLTDVVVLVVAADDGVMPTTVEAINHAKAADTTIVVALNKIDLPHDINKIYGQLTEQGLTPSGDWGGHTDVIKTSAISGEGIDELLTHLATLSEVMDLKADAKIPATGTVIEAERSEGLGNVARVLVQEGTLRAGDLIVCGPGYGRVRNIKDDHGRSLKEAGPSTPVEMTGLSDVPDVGDRFFVVDSAQRAKEIAEDTAARRREAALYREAKPTNLESVLATAAEGQIPELRVIIRADVQGSVDVLKQALSEFPEDQVRLDVIHTGVGTVTESDVVLAQASQAIIIAFHVVPDSTIQKLADNVGVDVRTYRIIYNVIDDIRKALEGLLTPDEKIESRGRVEVREIFNISKIGKIAGCYVREGAIQRNNMVRVVRDGVVVKDNGTIDSLRRFKDDAKEVKAGFECGVRVANFDDVKPGDVIEAFEVVKVARKLES